MSRESKLSDRIGAFTTIPNSIIKLWSHIGVDGMALFLYLRYRTNADTEIAFPAYTVIHAETCLTRRRIAAAIRALEKADILERKKRFGQSTLYTLKLPKPSSTPPGLLASPVVQQVDSSSPAGGLSVVQGGHTNKIDSNKIDPNKNGATAPFPPSSPRTPEESRQRVVAAMGRGAAQTDSLTRALETLTGRTIDIRNKTASSYIADLREWGADPKKCAHFAHYAQVVLNAPRKPAEPGWRGPHWKPTLKEVWESWGTAMQWTPNATGNGVTDEKTRARQLSTEGYRRPS